MSGEILKDFVIKLFFIVGNQCPVYFEPADNVSHTKSTIFLVVILGTVFASHHHESFLPHCLWKQPQYVYSLL